MSHDPGAKPYPFAWNLIPLLAGLIDPLLGVLGKLTTIFWWPRLPDRADSAKRRRRGLTLILGGIEGPSLYNYFMGLGLLRGRYRGAVVRFHWNAGVFGIRSLTNLVSTRHHERQSDLLVEAIVEHAGNYPGTPVCLMAQSGGCYITLRGLEKLPDGIGVQTSVLLAASISPGYDVTKAAAKCRRALVSVGCLGDFFFLGAGTLVFGTSDRVFSPSAGLVGWHHHPPRFVETRWHPSWLRFGYIGNHVSTSSPSFIRNVIASMLKGEGGD